MNYTALEELENFVFECLMSYSEKGIIDDLSYEWETCHHPDPKCLGGDKTTQLLKKHHAIHGVLQSEAYGHPCIYAWERRYLTDPTHIELFDKWQSEKGRRAGKIGSAVVHAETNEEGQSVHAVKIGKIGGKIGGAVIHAEKNDKGQSIRALELNKIIHEEKNDKGQSVHAVKMGEAAHAERNEEGKSIRALELSKLIHEEKNDKGQSINAVKAGEESAKKSRKPVLLTNKTTGETYLFSSGIEAARQLNLSIGALSAVLHGKFKQTKGFTAVFI